MGGDHEHKACSVSLQSLTQTCGDKARAVLLMARSGSGKNCGSTGKNQTQVGQSYMLTLLSSFCLAEMQIPSCLTRSEGTTSSCFDTCLSDTSVT